VISATGICSESSDITMESTRKFKFHSHLSAANAKQLNSTRTPMAAKVSLSECATAMINHIEVHCVSIKISAQFLAKDIKGITQFLNKKGHFSQATAINKGRTFSPRTFFDLFCSSIPEFAKIAVRLASKPSASGATVRDQHIVVTKALNRLTPE